jgi:hypothetical protein
MKKLILSMLLACSLFALDTIELDPDISNRLLVNKRYSYSINDIYRMEDYGDNKCQIIFSNGDLHESIHLGKPCRVIKFLIIRSQYK